MGKEVVTGKVKEEKNKIKFTFQKGKKSPAYDVGLFSYLSLTDFRVEYMCTDTH